MLPEQVKPISLRGMPDFSTASESTGISISTSLRAVSAALYGVCA